MNDSETAPGFPELSKRAARRLIQRAFVLVGRDRQVRQHFREARLTTRWVLEDWGFEWTVILDRGQVQFDRRAARRPDVTLAWPEAAGFFQWIGGGAEAAEGSTVEGKPEFCRTAEVVRRAFRAKLGEVVRFPFDDDGVRLA